jgi:hypothetical protein
MSRRTKKHLAIVIIILNTWTPSSMGKKLTMYMYIYVHVCILTVTDQILTFLSFFFFLFLQYWSLNHLSHCTSSFFFLFIYSHVHTLFGSFLPLAACPHCLPPTPSCFQAESVLPLSLILLQRRHKPNKKNSFC